MTNPTSEIPANDMLGEFIQKTDPALAERLLVEPEAYLELVKKVNTSAERTDDLVTSAVAAARHAGCTWQEIGTALETTAQATGEKFAAAVGQHAYTPEPDTRSHPGMLLFPLTAFNEIAVLNRAGLYGWHSVGYGPAYHEVERDDHQWQHASTLVGNLPSAGTGWVSVGRGWGPFSYWSRRLDTPALPGNPTRHQLVSGEGLPAVGA